MSSIQVRYHDAAGSLLRFVSHAEAHRYVANGTARAVRRRDGQIVRLYERETGRAHATARDGIAAMHAASRTTRRARSEGGALMLTREHLDADAAPDTAVQISDLLAAWRPSGDRAGAGFLPYPQRAQKRKRDLWLGDPSKTREARNYHLAEAKKLENEERGEK